jgi:hypothetical protein
MFPHCRILVDDATLEQGVGLDGRAGIQIRADRCLRGRPGVDFTNTFWPKFADKKLNGQI